MAEKRNRIAKAAVALAVAALVEKGVEAATKAVKNRRARRNGVAKAAGRKASALGSAARKQVPAVRKKAAKKLVRIAKAIEP